MLGKLRLYVRTVGYLRRDQLAHMIYRRILSKTSKPHRASSRARLRAIGAVNFHASTPSKALDRTFFGSRADGQPFDWHTSALWQPLRYQPHYFDYLLDPARTIAWKGAIVTDWIDKNAPDKGDGWIPYAVSLRMVNWIKYFIGLPSEAIDEAWIEQLYGHALWLENNLELHILANHYLKNAKALVFAGLYFEGADAERWRRRGLEIFLSQVREQFLPDGGHYERSPMYHSIAVEDLLDVFTFLSTGAVSETATTLEMLRQYATAGLDFMSALLMPDGTLPLFNDAADDVGPSPAQLYAYAKSTLGYARAAAPSGLTIRALQPSGYFVIRDGANMVAIDCGPLGPRYQPGHGHCDCLSYELALAGERVVVDSGVFDYENNVARRYARGTEAHNTVQIDGLQQSETWDVFRVARRADPILPSLVLSGPRQADFTGAHDGFASVKAEHHRTVRYDGGEWSFEDRIVGSGRHSIVSRVHLHPSLVVTRNGDWILISTENGDAVAELRPSLPVELRIEDAPYYPRFGSSETSIVVSMTLESVLPVTLSYRIVPRAAASAA